MIYAYIASHRIVSHISLYALYLCSSKSSLPRFLFCSRRWFFCSSHQQCSLSFEWLQYIWSFSHQTHYNKTNDSKTKKKKTHKWYRMYLSFACWKTFNKKKTKNSYVDVGNGATAKRCLCLFAFSFQLWNFASKNERKKK